MRVDQAQGGTNQVGVPAEAFAMPPAMRIRYDVPAPGLAACVTGYAIYVCDHRKPMINRYLPAPGMIVILLDAGAATVRFRHGDEVAMPQAALWGPTSHAYQTTTRGGISVGVGLSAEGWVRLTRASARAHRDRIVPLEEIIQADAVAAMIAALEALDDDGKVAPLLDRMLPALFREERPEDAQIRALDRLVVAGAPIGVDAVAENLGMDTRALRRLATDHFGMPAKTLLSRARFVRSLARWLLAGTPRSYAGIDASYHDQAHFLKDAHTYLGMTPRRFVRADADYLMASLRARAAVTGAAAHVLHGGV